jgi:hypothetical protein
MPRVSQSKPEGLNLDLDRTTYPATVVDCLLREIPNNALQYCSLCPLSVWYTLTIEVRSAVLCMMLGYTVVRIVPLSGSQFIYLVCDGIRRWNSAL